MVAVVEHLDWLVLQNGFGEQEQRHIRPAPRAIHRKKAQMELLPLQPGDVPDTEADVSDLIANVGYRPVVPVEQGVANFVAWYRDYYQV